MTVAAAVAVCVGTAAVAAAAVYASMKGRLARAEAEVAVGVARLEAKDAELTAERRRIEDMRRHYEDTRAQAETQFRALAQKVLEERSAKLKAEGTEQLQGVVNPLLKDIREFRERIVASDVTAAKNAGELKGQIQSLVTQTNAVSEQANNLADAIRGDVRLAGEWGEIQLKRVLECAGLQETVHYSYQETFYDDATGRKSSRTDVVVKIPGDRSLIIDSKVTLEAVADWHAAKDAEGRQRALDRLILSVRKHVDEIVAANYTATVPQSFPVVLMYIPLEEVYMAAMKALIAVGGAREPLRDYAARRNVVLVNSASVIPVMRLIEMMWKVDRSERNRRDIVEAANELLRRTNDFLQDFLDVGKALDAVRACYDSAQALLVDETRGRSIAKAARRLVDLGAQPKTGRGRAKELAAPIASASSDDA